MLAAFRRGDLLRKLIPTWLLASVLLSLPLIVSAHNISAGNARFVEGIVGPAIAPFMYLGAKHMVTW